MAEYTENYNLKKPAQEDFYNVEDFNNNADIVDSQLKLLSDGLGSAAQESTVSGINTKIGETGNTGGSATAGSVFAKLNKLITDITTHMGRWTAARAGYIDTINSNAASAKTASVNAQNYTATNNTASKTGILSQKGSYIISLLENATYGLSAIKNLVNTINADTNGTKVIPNTSNTVTVCSGITKSNTNKVAISLGYWKATVTGMVSVYCSANTTSSSNDTLSFELYNTHTIGADLNSGYVVTNNVQNTRYKVYNAGTQITSYVDGNGTMSTGQAQSASSVGVKAAEFFAYVEKGDCLFFYINTPTTFDSGAVYVRYKNI